MTSLPASRMRLYDRGVLRPGMAADLVAFDPPTVRERATYADPLHYSEGMPYVVVNGRLVVDGGPDHGRPPGPHPAGAGVSAEEVERRVDRLPAGGMPWMNVRCAARS